MKKIGVVGGLGPESTVEYYAGIIDAFKQSYSISGFPEIIIDSVNLKDFTKLAELDKWDEIAVKLARIFEQLRSAGADFGIMASNTPHRVFNEISNSTNLPLISIVDVTLKHVKSIGIRKLCLLGTKFTMSSRFYQDTFIKGGIELITPNESEQNYLQEKIFSELQIGLIKQETKQEFLRIIKRIESSENTEGVIMACTELPLILKKEDVSQAYIDPTQIHINSIVELCKETASSAQNILH